MRLSRQSVVLALTAAAALPIPMAVADDAGAPAAPASAAAPIEPEHDVDEGDRTQTPSTPKAAPAARQPVMMKDGMTRIPGGRFMMGSQEAKAPPNERPARVVTVSPFWIDRTEVTVGAYAACVERGACARPSRQSASCTYEAGDPALPVSCVPWSSAHVYCTAVGKRLPREVEWEFAARGTGTNRYPWGGGGTGCGAAATLVKDGSQKSCVRRPVKVGAHPGGASPFGILDMSGNVEEWVEDWYNENVSDLSPRAGASHVLRGGGWLSPPSAAKTTSRNWGSVREAGPNVGFRCARDD